MPTVGGASLEIDDSHTYDALRSSAHPIGTDESPLKTLVAIKLPLAKQFQRE